VFAQGLYFEGDYVGVAACPTIKVQHHHSGKILTAHRNSISRTI
jgi:hypothetical protein